MAPLIFILVLTSASGVASLTCRCANTTNPARQYTFCDMVDRPTGCSVCQGDEDAENAYRQMEALLSRILDVVMQGRDKNCCLRTYQLWACSVRLVMLDGDERTCKPCATLCQHVIQCCPFFLPGTIQGAKYPGYTGSEVMLDFRYGGLAAFNCPRAQGLAMAGSSYGTADRCYLYHNATSCSSAGENRPVICSRGQRCVVPICS